MPNKVRIAAKWNDEEGDCIYTLLINDKFYGEYYSEQAALVAFAKTFGVDLEIVYD